MPIHQYKCLKCGHEFQKLLPVGHHAEKCLECGHPETEKLLSAPGIHFKGGGFYKTDSQSKPAQPASAPEKTENQSKSKRSGDAAK